MRTRFTFSVLNICILGIYIMSGKFYDFALTAFGGRGAFVLPCMNFLINNHKD